MENEGSDGLDWGKASRWLVTLQIVGERLGLQFFLWPVGMVRFDVLLIICLNCFAAIDSFLDGVVEENRC